jgi:IS5 family transposase
MYQNSFLAIAQRKKELRCEKFLKEMNKVIPWDKFIETIRPHYKKKGKVGRNKKSMVMMLKIYFLQQWYGLSDPGAEEAIYDRNSFQKFLGIDLLSEAIPDETTILNFRHLLERHELQKQFFKIVKERLETKGLLMKQGTIADATLIAAPTSTKNKKKQRDPEMSSSKKGNKWHFGMKAHIGVDAQKGLIHTLETSTAKVHDREVFADLQHGEEEAIFGDKGYYSAPDKRRARKAGIVWGVLDKAKRGHALSNSQKKQNKKLSVVRAKVEHPFQVLKCQWGYCKVRYKGLKKNTLQLYTLFSLINIFKARKVLLAM